MSVLDDLMVATQHLIGWEEGAAELARLRRMADAYAREKSAGCNEYGKSCGHCGNRIKTTIDEEGQIAVLHTATCDVAAHLGLPREKGEGE